MLNDEELQELLDRYEGRISYGTYVDWIAEEVHNPEKRVVSASIIKCFLLYYVLKNRKKFKEKVPVSEFELTDDSLLNYFKGNTINLEAAMALMISVSDNTAANYFVDSIGMERMNEFLQAEGFNHTTFGRRFLDFVAKEEERENYTSVSDIRCLFEGILTGEKLGKDSVLLFESFLKMQFDRTKLTFYFPESIISGSKTGVLDNVWNDVMYFSDNGRIALIAFFTEDVPHMDVRDMLASYGQRCLRRYFQNLI